MEKTVNMINNTAKEFANEIPTGDVFHLHMILGGAAIGGIIGFGSSIWRMYKERAKGSLYEWMFRSVFRTGLGGLIGGFLGSIYFVSIPVLTPAIITAGIYPLLKKTEDFNTEEYPSEPFQQNVQYPPPVPQ